ncbi:hypothetical protein HOF92_07730 [bacterium]|jgi:hypothetical protein|nr:hypothetical protein [bacterium]
MGDKHIWDDLRNVKKALNCFFICCGILFCLDFLIHRHGHIPVEEWPGFYAVFGFIACILLVFIAKYILRPLVMRKEDYYDR